MKFLLWNSEDMMSFSFHACVVLDTRTHYTEIQPAMPNLKTNELYLTLVK